MAGTAIIYLSGYLAKDPEQVNDQGLMKLTIPVSTGKDAKQHTDWYNVFVYPNTPAARLNNWLKKGSNVIVTGKLTADVWMDKGNIAHCNLSVMANSVDFGTTVKPAQTEEQIVQNQNNQFNQAGGQAPQQPQQNKGWRQSNVQTNSTPNFEPSNDLPF